MRLCMRGPGPSRGSRPRPDTGHGEPGIGRVQGPGDHPARVALVLGPARERGAVDLFAQEQVHEQDREQDVGGQGQAGVPPEPGAG